MSLVTRRRLMVSAAGLVGAALTTEAEAATGTIKLHIVSGGLIVGVGGGDGVLWFQGMHYPLSLGGISLGATIGVSGADLVGNAYNLHAVQDIVGTYTAASAGAAIAGGVSFVRLSNANGVLLKLQGRQVGFKLSAALSGLSIALK